MTTNFYSVSISANEAPARALLNGYDTYVVAAASAADALSAVQAAAGNAKQWANATVTLLEPSSDLNGWSLRVQVFAKADYTTTPPTYPLAVTDLTVTNASATPEASATGTVTYTSTGAAAADKIVVNDNEITYVASGAVGNQINISGAFATDATALAAFINASPDQFAVTAHAVAGVVTLTAIEPGVSGNDISLVKTTGANIAVSGSGFLTGGTSANKLSSLAALAVTALIAAGYANAAFNTSTHVLTVAIIADGKGDHALAVSVLPPSTDYVSPTGVPTVGASIPGYVTAVVDSGISGAVLTATLVADDYPVPTVLVAAKSAE